MLRKKTTNLYRINLIKWCNSTFEINRQVRLKTSVLFSHLINLMYSLD